MTSVLVKTAPVWTRTRWMRRGANAATAIWCVGLVAFLVCAAARMSEEFVSAIGVLASGFFTLAFILKSWALRIEWRALAAADAARRELISSTSRSGALRRRF